MRFFFFITGHLKLSNAFLAPDESRIIGNMSVRDWKIKYIDRIRELVRLIRWLWNKD